jgi:cell wall-associated NlpC family hydrolase
VPTRPWRRTTLIGTFKRRGVAIPLGLLAAGVLGISVFAGVAASAAPQPSVAQVQARLNQVNSKFEQLVQQFDGVQQQLTSASQRLTLLNRETARYLSRFNAMRSQVAQIAATAYENGSLDSPVVLLTSGSAQTILNQASILQELSSSNNASMTQFLAAARQLTGAQQAARRTKDAETQLRNKLAGEKNKLSSEKNTLENLLAQLTPQQQTVTGPGTPNPPPSPPTGNHNPAPANGAAPKAVSFVYAQLGCPYVFGGNGPCNSGFDCSGLMQQAWAYAGVAIPRTSEEDWAQLPHISMSDLQPGDILVFNGAGHVGMFVGNGMLIDAPHPGGVVEKVALSGWYSQTLDGAVRP